MNLKFDINLDEISAQFNEFKLEVKQDLEKGVANLAAITMAKTVELASNDLHSSRKTYLDNLDLSEAAPGLWIISLDQDALWIEEGSAGGDMKPNLLKNGAKTSKDGTKYKSIPFDQGKAPSQMTPQAQGVVNLLKSALKKEGIPYKKIEKNADGSPRTGKLHTLNLGGPKLGRGNTGALQGVNIYQTVTKTGNVRRDIMTFRTVSNGPGSEGKWIAPGHEAKKYMDEAIQWATKIWEEQIMPEILSKWSK